jgi:hypothetical protein
MTITALDFLNARRDQLQSEIEHHRIRLALLDELIAALPAPLLAPPPSALAAMTAALPPPQNIRPNNRVSPQAKRITKTRKSGLGAARIRDIMLSLEAAGTKGITSRELADVLHIPVGSAGSRLSQLKNLGHITHVAPRYYLLTAASTNPIDPVNTMVVHSQAEDNNTSTNTGGIFS